MPAPSPTSAASVRLEVRIGSGRPSVYEVGDGGFLIGSVPGCDLRLPGANLAPVICLVARHATGASLRKLAPVQPIILNGKAITATYLSDGDRITIGSVDMLVHLSSAVAVAAPVAKVALDTDERLRKVDAREKQLHEEAQALESERASWIKRREDIQKECLKQTRELEEWFGKLQQQQSELAQTRAELENRESSWRHEQLTQTGQQSEMRARLDEIGRQEAEIETLRFEMSRIRSEFAQRFQQRKEKLNAKHLAVRRAGQKLIARKHAADEREARLTTLEQEWGQREADFAAQSENLQRDQALLEEQYRIFGERQQETQRELASQFADLEQREHTLNEEKALVEKTQKQHQSELVRLDRIHATIEQRQKQLQQRALEIDRKFEQLQRDTRDLEEQAAQMDDWHNRLSAEAERLAAQKAEQDTFATQFEHRANALESQQTMLATLRTRLERMREELRRQEQALSDQRLLQDASEADLKARLDEAELLRSDLGNEKQLFEEERRRFDERRSTLEQAVTQLRHAQNGLTAEQAELQKRQEEIEITATEQAEQAAVLITRGEQLEQSTRKLESERKALQEREAALARAEQTLATLQDQVRRRADELDQRQQRINEEEADVGRRSLQAEERLIQSETAQQQGMRDLDRQTQELLQQTKALEARVRELAQREQAIVVNEQRIAEAEKVLVGQRQSLAAERVAWEVDKQSTQERQHQAQEEFGKIRDEMQSLSKQLPEMEIRGNAALERLVRAREQLREHLNEVHNYARQSRDDLDTARKDIHAESERVRQQELDLQIARDEHRLAVAAFRQQMIEWQGRVGEMRQSLEMGTSQLERRQAEVEQQAQQVADTTARLAEQSEELERQKRQVAERRGEVDRHLVDMREWYRRKLREVVGIDVPAGEPGEGDIVPMPAASPTSTDGDRDPSLAVLSLADEIAPADRQLGELLARLELVDDDTLQALWAEARRQRRTLRQLLLAGGYLTLYQMALIEAGNLDGLVLGPVRVIDRLPSTPREAVYRVYDPRRNGEAVLRHLAESEMHDAVHPDEFQQRFTAAASVQHSNVASVLEVLSINGRPAALVEWVNGLAAADWPALVSAPGVWFRLLAQAALGLYATHTAGLCHGHLDGRSFVLTGQGILKLLDVGEPHWLATTPVEAENVAGDLTALGRLARQWAALPASGKSKAKPLPDELQMILSRLTGEAEPFVSAQALVEELERVGPKVQASTTAWDRLLRQVREQLEPVQARKSA